MVNETILTSTLIYYDGNRRFSVEYFVCTVTTLVYCYTGKKNKCDAAIFWRNTNESALNGPVPVSALGLRLSTAQKNDCILQRHGMGVVDILHTERLL